MKTLLLAASAAMLTAAAFADDAPRFGTFGFDATGMSAEVDPGDDFNRYANGAWLETAEIPSDRARYGVFDMLRIRSEEQIEAIVKETAAAGDAPAGSNAQLVGDMYRAWMDADAIEARGLAPAQPYLDEIGELESLEQFSRAFASVHFASPFSIGVIPDPADTSRYTLWASQSGLGLPNRDYYLNEEERFEEYRTAYRAYMRTIFELGGHEDPEAATQAVYAFERRLADVHWTNAENRDIQRIYNVRTLEDLETLAPELDWRGAFEARGIGDVEQFVVAQPEVFDASAEIVAETDPAVLRDYLTFHFLSNNAGALPAAFDEARFDFYGRTLSGTEEQRPRDRRGALLVDGRLGDAVGQIYLERHFPPESKAQMDALVGNLIEAFSARLETLAWMDEETRAEALEKLSTFEPKIGYPEKWDEFAGYEVRPDDHFGNMRRYAEFSWAQDLEDFGGPVDREDWSWSPQVVNASYNPLLNQITFPAGILQPPFFDPNADAAINYGAIGAVIGHEIGHGFDDQGRRFDAEGRIRDWWTEETNSRFVERSDVLVEQYGEFEPIEGMPINGRLALGENIGDLGGMEMAYGAWRDYVAETYPDGEAPVIDGFTGDQRFFLAWAQVWRILYREDALRAQIVNGPHSPGEFRINGVVRNMDAWYAAFDVAPDDALYLPPDQRVSIW